MKTKSFKGRKRAASEDSASPPPKSKKSKGASGSNADDESEYWELSKNRRVTVSNFKGKNLVNIREFYDADGKMMPGKKGISLSIEQYVKLIEALPAIEAALKKEGEKEIPRPAYDQSATTAAGEDEEEDEEEEIDEKKATKKSNIEATSDENED